MPQEVGKVVLPRTIVGKSRTQVPTSGRERGQAIPTDNFHSLDTSIRDRRGFSTAAAFLRQLFRVDGIVSSVAQSLVGFAMSGYSVSGYQTGTLTMSPEAIRVAQALLASWDTVWDYSQGYADKPSVNTILEQALLEVALTGGVGAELVLNTGRLPDRLQLFGADTIIWESNGKGGKYPTQRARNPRPGQPSIVQLNLPTVWVAESLKTLDQVYSLSFLYAGLGRLIHFDEFIEDMRRVVRASGAPRPVLKIKYEEALRTAPIEYKNDPEKLKAYLESVRSSVETIVGTLAPEEALVVFDIVEVDSIASVGEKADYKEMLDALSGLTASAMKSNPSALGLRLGGSQNVATVEALLYAKVAANLQNPVEEIMSRALTLGIRLAGVDGFIKFKFNEIELRPKTELESHLSIRQNRTLEQLSLGRITDDEAQIALGLGPLPPGAPKLSGTMFYETKAPSETPSPNSDPNGRQVSSDQPTSAGGKDNEKR